MKRLIYLLILILISCNGHKQAADISFHDYRYPLDSVIEPKVFIYERTDSVNFLTAHFEQLISKNNQLLLIRYSLAEGNMRDSSVFIVSYNSNPMLLESFLLMKDKKTNLVKRSMGQIIKRTDNGSEHHSKIRYTNPFDESLISIITSNSVYDTILIFPLNDKKLDCLRFKENHTISIKHKYIPFIGKSFERSGESIIAKGIGLVYYSTTDPKTKLTYSFRLKEIINYNQYLKH